MVVVRLSRGGAKKKPFYHLVATDKRNARDGRFIEKLGYFNPMARGAEVRFHVNAERLQHWQAQGAQLSDRVSALVKEHEKASVAA
ncbi:MAG: 30S ribosomal protein S16 [Legionellales bacterium]|nr:30S ribosomal protein S16 [Legionellales bacterium]